MMMIIVVIVTVISKFGRSGRSSWHHLSNIIIIIIIITVTIGSDVIKDRRLFFIITVTCCRGFVVVNIYIFQPFESGRQYGGGPRTSSSSIMSYSIWGIWS